MTGTIWSLVAGNKQGLSAAWISGFARAGSQGLTGSRSLARGWARALAGHQTPVTWWRRGLGSGCWRLLRPADRGLGAGAWAVPCLAAWGSGRVGGGWRPGGVAGGGLGVAGWPRVRLMWAGLFAYQVGRN
jgi:hypothetical protein